MATGSGRKIVHNGVEHLPGRTVIILREIFYVRFIEWFFSTPLILLNLALLSGLAWIDVFTMLILDELMILCALMGGLVTNSW
jgi:bacteriorhodopsin